MQYDLVIIGAGVVGLACGAEGAKYGLSTLVVERHESFGQETSSRNSEVIHSGIYYPTGSLKARLCVTANKNLYNECNKTGVWNRRCGKLIVAVEPDEIEPMKKLYQRGIDNGVEGLKLIDASEVKKYEPSIRSVGAIYLPTTGIIDSHELMKSYLAEIKSYSGDVAFGVEFLKGEMKNGLLQLRFQDNNDIEMKVESRFVVNSGGLWADKVASRFGIDIENSGYKMHHNRGHYYTVSSQKSKLISHLVYPLPHQHLVSVGIHITIDKAGQVNLGPDMDYLDPSIPESEWYKFDETRKEKFFEAVKRYFPAIELSDLSPGQVGVRPKLKGSEDQVKDFIIREESDRSLRGLINLIGIESPGLTCSREIAREVVSIINNH